MVILLLIVSINSTLLMFSYLLTMISLTKKFKILLAGNANCFSFRRNKNIDSNNNNNNIISNKNSNTELGDDEDDDLDSLARFNFTIPRHDPTNACIKMQSSFSFSANYSAMFKVLCFLQILLNS